MKPYIQMTKQELETLQASGDDEAKAELERRAAKRAAAQTSRKTAAAPESEVPTQATARITADAWQAILEQVQALGEDVIALKNANVRLEAKLAVLSDAFEDLSEPDADLEG